jgi:hypothetical protein
MKVGNINNSTTFGVRIIGKKWNPAIIRTLEDSNILKEIDAKYPNASVNYFHFKHNDMANDEDIWTTLFDINLNPKRIWHYRLDSHTKTVPDKNLVEKLRNLSLNDLESEIEKQIKEGTTLYFETKVTIAKKNPIKEFFSKIFGKKN